MATFNIKAETTFHHKWRLVGLVAVLIGVIVIIGVAVWVSPSANADPNNAPDPSLVPTVASAFAPLTFFCTGDTQDDVRFVEAGGASIAERNMTLQLLEIKDGTNYLIADANLASGFGSQPVTYDSVLHVPAGIRAHFNITLKGVSPEQRFGLRAKYDDVGQWAWLATWTAAEKDKCGFSLLAKSG